jgi:hypothetical protein
MVLLESTPKEMTQPPEINSPQQGTVSKRSSMNLHDVMDVNVRPGKVVALKRMHKTL